jgi:putative glycosyltransferase (TIGR04372 family)
VDYRASTTWNNASLQIEGALEAQAVQELSKLGISPNDQIALINARDDAYYRNLPGGASYEDVKKLRNADIETYAAASRYLVSKGYVVVRMGAKVKSAITFSGDAIIDYATSGYRSELLDVYLFQKCRLVISNATGIDALAFTFRKPMLYTNFSYLVGLSLLYHILDLHFILKVPFCVESGKPLSIKECFERAPAAVWDDLILNEAKIRLQDNSSDEILDATQDLVRSFNTYTAQQVTTESNDCDCCDESFWATYFRSTLQSPTKSWPRSTISPSFWRSRKAWLA